MIRIVIQDLVKEAFERPVIDDGQNAKRAVVQLVDGDGAGEVSQGPVEIRALQLPGCLFPPASTQFWMVA